MKKNFCYKYINVLTVTTILILVMSRVGSGFLNRFIDKLNFELHVPGYQYCGPGTALLARIQRGDPGINPLDAACKEHDIAYYLYKDLNERHKADRILQEKAADRAKNSSSAYERLTAKLISVAMKTKVNLGMGLMKKKGKIRRKKIGKGAAQTSTLRAVKLKKGIRKIRKKMLNKLLSRTIPTPSKQGGILPLIFAGLSALGALAGGTAAIAKTVKETSAAKKNLQETERHNRAMEAVAALNRGKGLRTRYQKKRSSRATFNNNNRGKGLYLKPYKRGSALCLDKNRGKGLYLKPYKRGSGLSLDLQKNFLLGR